MIDVIVTHPRHVDYPVFRHQLQNLKKFVNKIYIVLMSFNMRPDRTVFLKNEFNLLDVEIIEKEHDPKKDWRDLAVKSALSKSWSDFVLFLEQDFFLSSVADFEKIKDTLNEKKVIGFFQGNRLHPAFLICHKNAIQKINPNFGVSLGKDHFDVFSYNLRKHYEVITLESLNIEYRHMNGLTQNMTMLQNNELPSFEIKKFKTYLSECEMLSRVENIRLTRDFRKLKDKLKYV